MTKGSQKSCYILHFILSGDRYPGIWLRKVKNTLRHSSVLWLSFMTKFSYYIKIKWALDHLRCFNLNMMFQWWHTEDVQKTYMTNSHPFSYICTFTHFQDSSYKIKVDRIDAIDKAMEIVHKLGTCLYLLFMCCTLIQSFSTVNDMREFSNFYYKLFIFWKCE